MTRTGDKRADYLMNKHASEYVNMYMSTIIDTPWYSDLSKEDQKVVITKRLRAAQKMVRGIAEGEGLMKSLREGKGYSVFDKGGWNKLTATQRRLANEYFQTYCGASVSELGAYKSGITIGRALEGALK
jgi:hypothetical protein